MHASVIKPLAALLTGYVFLVGLAVPVSAHAGIVYTGVYAQQNFFQDANGVVPWSQGSHFLPWGDPGNNAEITFTLATTNAAQGAGATMTLPGSNTPRALTGPAPDWNDPYFHFDYHAEGYASLAQLFAAYPGGAYHFNGPAAGNTPQTQNATLNFNPDFLKNSAMASTMPMLTNYGSLQNLNAASTFTFTFNSFNGFGAPPAGYVEPYTQIGIFDLAKVGQGLANSVVYVSPHLTNTSTSFILGANTLQPGTNYGFAVNFDSFCGAAAPALCPGGHELASYTLGAFTTAQGPAVPPTLVHFQGGTQANPVELPDAINKIGAVSGTIGGAPDVDYYKFFWAGGEFAATATLTGALASDFFNFELIDFVSGDVLEKLTLDQLNNNFNGTLSQRLAAGVYVIGINCNHCADPAFTISFDSSGQFAAPEPGTVALLTLAGVALMKSRSGRRSSALRAGFCKGGTTGLVQVAANPPRPTTAFAPVAETPPGASNDPSWPVSAARQRQFPGCSVCADFDVKGRRAWLEVAQICVCCESRQPLFPPNSLSLFAQNEVADWSTELPESLFPTTTKLRAAPTATAPSTGGSRFKRRGRPGLLGLRHFGAAAMVTPRFRRAVAGRRR